MNIDKQRIPKGYDKRCKITDDDRDMVVKLRQAGYSQEAIAEKVGISRGSVVYILKPEKVERDRELHKARAKDKRYYNTAKHKLAMRRHRAWKRQAVDKQLDPVNC